MWVTIWKTDAKQLQLLASEEVVKLASSVLKGTCLSSCVGFRVQISQCGQ